MLFLITGLYFTPHFIYMFWSCGCLSCPTFHADLYLHLCRILLLWFYFYLASCSYEFCRLWLCKFMKAKIVNDCFSWATKPSPSQHALLCHPACNTALTVCLTSNKYSCTVAINLKIICQLGWYLHLPWRQMQSLLFIRLSLFFVFERLVPSLLLLCDVFPS